MTTDDDFHKVVLSTVSVLVAIAIILVFADVLYWGPARQKALQIQHEKNLKVEYNIGMQAAQLGIGAKANPHIGDRWRRDEAQSWLKGYMDGKTNHPN